MSGPTTVSGSSGSPTFRRPAAACSPATTWSYTPRCAITRVGAVQIWPAVERPHAGDGADGGLEVGVVEHDAGALAAELEQQALHVAPGDLADGLADRAWSR